MNLVCDIPECPLAAVNMRDGKSLCYWHYEFGIESSPSDRKARKVFDSIMDTEETGRIVRHYQEGSR